MIPEQSGSIQVRPGPSGSTRVRLSPPGPIRVRPDPPGYARVCPIPPGSTRVRPGPPGSIRVLMCVVCVGAGWYGWVRVVYGRCMGGVQEVYRRYVILIMAFLYFNNKDREGGESRI